jgi:UDP-N-acetylmuramate dehydrogenase
MTAIGLPSSEHYHGYQQGKISFVPSGLRGQLRHHEPMAEHSSWRAGGCAEWFYIPADLEDLIQFMPQIPLGMPVFWCGLGSNILVRDRGLPGVVIATAGLLNGLTWLSSDCLRVEAGVSCAKIARETSKMGLTGAEFLAGIPGTLGGALAMNAGAWGGETWNLVQSVEVLTLHGEHRRRAVVDYQVGYRHVMGPSDEWFVAATLKLAPDSDGAASQRIRELLKQRNEKQPIGLPSCGSVFRNPPGDYAARLIEAAGLKGRIYGGACVSEKHANFIINQHQATAHDIETLIHQVQQAVAEQFGVHLQTEVRIIGCGDTVELEQAVDW